MIKLLKKITLIFLTFQPRWVKKKIISCSNGLDLYTQKVGNPDLRIAAYARKFGVNVERVLSKEVHSESFSKDTDDSVQTALNSHQEIDSTSVGHSSRPSAACTSASGYDGSRSGTNDGGDNAR